jgi:hypothetical protein
LHLSPAQALTLTLTLTLTPTLTVTLKQTLIYYILTDSSNTVDKVSSTAQTFNRWGVIDVLTRSPSAVFAHNDLYPLTLQITPSETLETLILLQLISQRYQWKSVAVFFTFDTQVGLDSITEFVNSATDLGVGLLVELPSGASESDFTAGIKSARESGATIFVLLMTGSSAGHLMEQGYNEDLFNTGTQVLTTSTAIYRDIILALTPAGLLNQVCFRMSMLVLYVCVKSSLSFIAPFSMLSVRQLSVRYTNLNYYY